MPNQVYPSLLEAADNHNIASGNQSWFESVLDSIGNAPKYFGLAIASGVAGLASTVHDVSELGYDAEAKTEGPSLESWLADYDDDLGRYYRENKGSIDTFGFIIGSAVPGLGGVKAFNLGQKALQTSIRSGTLGTNMARAAGVLVPNAERHIAKSALEIAATSRAARMLEINRLKALGSKSWQGALDTAAFETAALATQYKSPFLEDQDWKDIALNFGINVVLGAGLIGAFSIPGTVKAVGKEVHRLDKIGAPGRLRTSVGDKVPPTAQITQALLDKKAAQEFISYQERMVANLGKVEGPNFVPPTEEGKAIAANWISTAKNNIQNMDNSIAQLVSEISAHPAASSAFVSALTKSAPTDAINAILTGSKLIREADVQSVLRDIAKRTAELKKADKTFDNTTGITWHQLWGQRGQDLARYDGDAPVTPWIADTVKLKGQKDTIKKAVNRAVNNLKFRKSVEVNVLDPTMTPEEVLGRYLKASRASIKDDSVIGEWDIPYLERAQELLQTGEINSIRVAGKDGTDTFTNASDMWEFLKRQKDAGIKDAVNKGLLTKEGGLTFDAIAQRTNVSEPYMLGTGVSNIESENWLAWQSAAQNLGLKNREDLFYRPKYMGVYSELTPAELADSNRFNAELWTESIRIANEKTVNNVVTKAMHDLVGPIVQTDQGTGTRTVGSVIANLPEDHILSRMVGTLRRQGARPGMFHYANGRYGTLEMFMSHIGHTTELINRKLNIKVDNALEEARRIILGNSEAAAEFSVTNQLVRQRADTVYRLNKDKTALVALDDRGQQIAEAIEFANPETAKIWEAHIGLLNEKNSAMNKLNAARGIDAERDIDRAYAYAVDPTRFKHFVHVIDPTIAGAGNKTMLWAHTAADLEDLVSRVHKEFPHWEVYTKSQAEKFYKSRNLFDFDRTIHDVYMDSRMASKGISATALPRTDGKFLADELITWHKRSFRGLTADMIEAKYANTFGEIRAYSEAGGNFADSRVANLFDASETKPKDPYLGYIKTALNISSAQDIPLLTPANRLVDNIMSKMWNAADAKVREIRGVDQKRLDELHNIFQHHGFQTGYYDAAMHLLINHPAGREVATKFIRAVNGVLASTFLRYDPFNMMVNKFGSVILNSSEMTYLIEGIKRGDREGLGKLAMVKLPEVGDEIFSPFKLMANSNRRYAQDIANGGKIAKSYKDLGVDPNLTDQIGMMFGEMTLTGAESVNQFSGKLGRIMDGVTKIGQGVEKWTGNKWAEHHNRFVAADMMTQLTDLAIAQGLITKGEAAAYIRAFVNNTQVNLLAAQRPLIFQGPIGMAMGLFQSYQFNLMQQLFKYSERGLSKELAMFGGLQSTFFGMSGVPGYQALNAYVMQLHGNEEHKDLDNVLSEAAGLNAANFFLYGIPSNLFQGNLFVRGDATPQNPTVLPTNVGEFPLINMWGNFFSNLKRTAGNVYEGADLWPTFLSGLEHNGINRPLVGLAQVLRAAATGAQTGDWQVKSYDKYGNFISGNDLFSLATLSRLAGGKPFDEALAKKELWKMKGVRAAQREQLMDASAALRLSMQSEGGPSSDQIMNIYNTFIQSGHRSIDFNRWLMDQYKRVNESQFSQIKDTLANPLSFRLQEMLGGVYE